MGEVKIKSKIDVDIKIHLELTVEEAKALSNITAYGTEYFTGWFYKHLGKFYLKPHERGLISLFDTIGKQLPSRLKQVEQISKEFNKFSS